MESREIKRLGPGLFPAILLLFFLAVSLYLFKNATEDPESFGRLYPPLLILTAIELVVLIWLIGSNLARLWRQYRNKATGSRLSVRLIAVFVLLAVAPVSIVY